MPGFEDLSNEFMAAARGRDVNSLLMGPSAGVGIPGVKGSWWKKLGITDDAARRMNLGAVVDPGVAAPEGARWATTAQELKDAENPVDYGDVARKSFGSSPEYLGAIEKYREMIKSGMTPQQAQDRLIGAGAAQQKPVGLEGTQNIDPATGKPWSRLTPPAAPGNIRPLGAPSPAPTGAPRMQDAGGYLTPEYKAYLAEQARATNAAADALDQKNAGSLEGLAYKRIAEGADPYTGVSKAKTAQFQSTLGNVSGQDRATLLRYSDPASLDTAQRAERRAIRAPDWNEAMNDRQAYMGKSGARHLDARGREAFKSAGDPGGFYGLTGSKEYIDPTTGRETIATGLKGLNYAKPSYDRFTDITKRVGAGAIGAGFGILTGGTGLLGMGLAGLGAAQGGLTGEAIGGKDLAIGTALGAVGSVIKGAMAARAAKAGRAAAAIKAAPGAIKLGGAFGAGAGVGFGLDRMARRRA